MSLQQLAASQANPETVINENFDAVFAAAIFSKRHPATTGLTWGYYGGLYNGNAISDGTVTLTNTSDNYVVVLRSTGVVSTSTTSTNSLDPLYAKLYKVTCAGGVVTAVVDQRLDANGLLFTVASVDRRSVSVLSISSGVVNINYALGDYFTLALNANVTSITFSNLPAAGGSVMVRITQDSTPRTVAWPASFKWADGAAGAVSTGSAERDVLAITTFDGGTAWNATLAKAFA